MTTPRDAVHARAIAAQAVCDVVIARRFLDVALAQRSAGAPASALIQELTYGTLRWYHALQCVSELFLHKPLKRKDADLHALLLIGIYQLRHMRVAAHAAVDATVGAAGMLGKSWAKGLLNACLRGVLREPERVAAAVAANEVARYSHPRWLIDAIAAAYPERWQTVLAANNERPPMVLRVNRRATNIDDYLALLRAAGIEAAGRAPHESAIALA